MNGLLGIFSLRRISGQIAALVLVSIVAIHLLLAAVFLLHRPDEQEATFRGHGEVTAAILLLGATAPADRPQLIAHMAQAFPQFEIRVLDNTVGVPNEPRDEPDLRNIHRHLGPGYRMARIANAQRGETAVTLPDGAVIGVKIPPDHFRPFWGGPWTLTLLFVVSSLTVLGLWAARALAAPLSSFAKAAENFSLNGAASPLLERGPEEIRAVARALNRMRERIGALIDDRTKMLAAISHDLRTPITRLRLRSEFIEDDGHRRHMLRDLDQMQSMLEAVLSYLRDGRRLENLTLTDIATTLQLIADQFADIGHNVSYHGPSHALVMARPDDLHRAVTNLVENAVKFGNEARITLAMTAGAAVIEVGDDGPGISDARKAAMLQPFVRGDDARNMDHEAAGFGLGLSIARAIVLAHSGELTLLNNEPHGLVVRIALPAPDAGRVAA